MMQAVIKSGSKQYLVQPNQTLAVERLTGNDQELKFEPLLVIDGDSVQVGTPVVAGVTVTAKVVGEVKGEKLRVLHYKPKKRISKQTGHRQTYTSIQITGIKSAKAAPKATSKETKPAAKPA